MNLDEMHAQALRKEFDHVRVAVRVREGSQFGAVWDAVLDLQGALANTRDRLAVIETAARALYEQVEMDESVGICLTDRTAALALGHLLGEP